MSDPKHYSDDEIEAALGEILHRGTFATWQADIDWWTLLAMKLCAIIRQLRAEARRAAESQRAEVEAMKLSPRVSIKTEDWDIHAADVATESGERDSEVE